MTEKELLRELSTKMDISKSFGIVKKLIKSYGIDEVYSAVKKLPLGHKSPIGYIMVICRKAKPKIKFRMFKNK